MPINQTSFRAKSRNPDCIVQQTVDSGPCDFAQGDGGNVIPREVAESRLYSPTTVDSGPCDFAQGDGGNVIPREVAESRPYVQQLWILDPATSRRETGVTSFRAKSRNPDCTSNKLWILDPATFAQGDGGGELSKRRRGGAPWDSVPVGWLVGGLGPGGADTDGDIERNTELDSIAHFCAYYLFQGFLFTRGDLEDQLIVDLQEHP